jgi:hypothetical protein
MFTVGVSRQFSATSPETSVVVSPVTERSCPGMITRSVFRLEVRVYTSCGKHLLFCPRLLSAIRVLFHYIQVKMQYEIFFQEIPSVKNNNLCQFSQFSCLVVLTNSYFDLSASIAVLLAYQEMLQILCELLICTTR